MRLLAIETCTEACSAALYLGPDEVHTRFEIAPREHSRLILAMLDDLLSETGIAVAQLDAVAFGRGPGSFTSVRIGAATVQGIALAADLPVVPVSTLAALAQGLVHDLGTERILAAIDARMQEVYWCAYTAVEGRVHATMDECVSVPDQVPLPEGRDWVGAGTGWGSYRSALHQRLAERIVAEHPERLPSARDVAILGAAGFEAGEAVAAEQALPVYLRDRVVG